MSALSLQDSDHPPEQNTNLPNGHQDLVASSKGQHPDSTPNLQACTQSEAQAPGSPRWLPTLMSQDVPVLQVTLVATSGKWHFKYCFSVWTADSPKLSSKVNYTSASPCTLYLENQIYIKHLLRVSSEAVRGAQA